MTTEAWMFVIALIFIALFFLVWFVSSKSAARDLSDPHN